MGDGGCGWMGDGSDDVSDVMRPWHFMGLAFLGDCKQGVFWGGCSLDTIANESISTIKEKDTEIRQSHVRVTDEATAFDEGSFQPCLSGNV